MQYCEALIRAGRLDEGKAVALELVGQLQELLAFDMVATEMIKRGDEVGAAAFREKISPTLRERAAKEFRSLLVTTAAAADDAQRAVRHFEQLPADERTYPPCLAIVGVLYRTGDTAGARRYMKLARAAAQMAGDSHVVQAYQTNLALEMAAGGDIDAALQWAEALPEKQDRDNAMVHLVIGCASAGQFDRALPLIKAMAEEDQRVSTAHPFARSAAQKNRWSDLPAWIDALPGARERAVACLAVAEVCAALPGAVNDTRAAVTP